MVVIQMFLPLCSNAGMSFPTSQFETVIEELTQQFGGAAAYLRAPASGSWQDGSGDVKRDDVVVYEVLAETIDELWWKGYRQTLESAFRQEEIFIRAHEVAIL